MALFGKLGNILRQTYAKQIKSDVSLSNPSIHQMIRCMSSCLFVGGLSYNTDERGLREGFSKYGEVTDVKLIVDRETGQSRGFGFVTFANAEEASSAIQAVDQKELNGRTVKVNYAVRKAPQGPVGGYGGNGYNNQSSYGGGGYEPRGYGGDGNNQTLGGGGFGAQGYGGGGYNQTHGGGGYGTQGYGGENQAYVPPTQTDGTQGYGGDGYNQTHGGGCYGTQGYNGENQAYVPRTQSDGSAGNFSFSGGNNSYADPSHDGYNASFGQNTVSPPGGSEGVGGDIGFRSSA